MYSSKRPLVAKIFLPSWLSLLALATFAAPPSVVGYTQPPVHFLSDRFQSGLTQNSYGHFESVKVKPMLHAPSAHFDRIPKSYLIFGLRSVVNGKMVCTDRLGHPLMSFPMPKCRLVRKAGR